MASDTVCRGDLARLLAIPVFSFVAAAAHAGPGEMFVCTDASGRRITADRPPPECYGRPIKELRSDGSIRRVIEPPLTPEQQAQRAAEEQRKAEEDNQRRQQARRDRALLEAYGEESDIEEARVRALESRRVVIDRAKKRMVELQGERKKLDTESEFYTKRDIPEKLKRAYDTHETMVQAQEKIIADTEAEMKRIDERFNVERKRFRELVQGGARPVVRDSAAAQ